jgi:predicted unusual protein kinase regulating ubiquinone biosynthesis (AarF/ABC1/UbiB family)
LHHRYSSSIYPPLRTHQISKKLEENSDARATELSTLLTVLGPSFIKVGQSLSIRTDLLSPAYVRGLKSLQDQVPPFPTPQAIKIIEDELGSSIQDVFVDFSDEPIAAASLGQVYKAKLKVNGQEVAVKVQRPDIMSQIALDMHLLRQVIPKIRAETIHTIYSYPTSPK